MKKKFLVYLVIAISFLMLYANSILLKDYSINIFQYFYLSRDFTPEEKKWIRENSPIIYGADESSPPLRFVDPDTKQFKGVVVDYLNSLSIQLGGEIRFVPYVWSEALEKLEKGQTHLADLFISEERSQKFIFSIPIYKLKGSLILSNSSAKVNTVTDLKRKKVALPKGDYAEDYLREHHIDVDFVYVKNILEGIEAIHSGQADVLVGDEPVLAYYLDLSKYQNTLYLSNFTLYEENVVLATSKKNPMLITVINKSILQLEKGNAVERIQEKWTGITTPVSSKKGLRRPSFILTVCLTIFLLILSALNRINTTLKRDVNKRNEELYRSKLDLEYIFESIPEMMLIADSDYQIIRANNLLLNFIQVPFIDLRGQSLYAMKPLTFLKSTKGIYDDVLETGQTAEMDIEYQERIYHIACYPMKYNLEEEKSIIISIKDITFQKLNEQQLLQVNKMAAIGELAAGVAHEIRNPLGIIRSYIFLMKDYNVQHLNQGQFQKSIAAIEKSVDRAKKIIDNLLNFSRISNDFEEEIPLKEFVEELLALEEKRMKKANIDFKVDCPPDLAIVTKKESLKHIMMNLIINAIDAMEQGGHLIITCHQTKNYLSIQVEDTGIGISEDIIDSIFNPFFTTKPPNQGTGLGLYITYNEVQKLGGRVTVKSIPNVGTIFEIKL